MFKVTIREAILMTTIVAILAMWWMERNQNAKNEARLTAIETRLQAFQFVPIMPASSATAAPSILQPKPGQPILRSDGILESIENSN